MSDSLRERMIAITKIKTSPNKAILLRDRDVNDEASMVISGLVRPY